MLSRVASVAVVVLLLSSACTRGSTSTSKASPSPSQSPSISASAVIWTDCGKGFQCGKVNVPLDYSNPTADIISIAVIRMQATDPVNRLGSVLMNPGGPGASGIEFLKGEASSMKRLNERFDLVGFDPRGVGQSSPVRCFDAAQESAYFALDSVLDDPQEKQAFIQTNKDYAAACQLRSSKILPFVDTVSAARDMDLIRIAVGDAKLTYLGFSYGTFLGLTYAHLFPTHIRALSLDAVVDPKLSAADLAITQIASFEKNLQAFLADCKARASCAFGRSGDPGAKLTSLSQRIDARPIAVGNRTLTRALALTGIALAMYDQRFWPVLDQALTMVQAGDGTVLLELADLLVGRQPDGTYSNEIDANWAVNCLDRPVATDIASYDALGPAYAQASPFFGPSQQYGSNLQCAYWAAKPTGQPGPLTADGAPPILLVGGTDDPATPYAWAQSVHQQLAGSVLLTRQGNGHTSYDASPCAHAAEDAYLIGLILPADGTTCSS